MEIQEILQLSDELVFAHTGKHLYDIQITVLQGVCRHGQKYIDIAEENGFSEGHVRNTASKLFQMLSESLGEVVSRNNFRSVMERRQLFIVSSNFLSDNDFVNIGNLNVCRDISSNKPSPSTSDQLQEDLSDIPDLIKLSDRQKEIATLEKWILQEGCHLIAIVGNCGIGKTALACYLLQKSKTNFEVVIWLNLNLS